MKVFIDASAIVAMIAREPEATSFARYMMNYDELITSPVTVWEAARGVEGARGVSFVDARQLVDDFLQQSGIMIVSIDAGTGHLALDAHQRYGKGVHEAKLNFGDCFAYACAKQHDAELMFKGEDFIHTDMRDATLP